MPSGRLGSAFGSNLHLYEVHDGPYRTWAFPEISPHVKAHTFYLVLRRLDDGRFFKTIPGDPVALQPIRRPRGTCHLDSWRKIPYFRLVDRRGFYICDTDNGTRAANACNRLLDFNALIFSPYVSSSRMADFSNERRRILAAEKANLRIARALGWRIKKAFSLGMREPWPPEEILEEKYNREGRYPRTYNIITPRGHPLCSTDDCREAGEFWNVARASDATKAGIVISGMFEEYEEITNLLHEFQSLIKL